MFEYIMLGVAMTHLIPAMDLNLNVAADETGTLDAVSLDCRLQRAGGIPATLENLRVKLDWSANPQSRAISEIGAPVWVSWV
jgi:hypothetical protein